MTTNAVWPIDGESVLPALLQAGEKLGSTEGDVTLDFSSVHRLNSGALKAMEKLAGIAADKGVKVSLSGINVDIYRVLKLVNLTPRFSFLT
jgi:anti-anti-sigma regulatory factor